MDSSTEFSLHWKHRVEVKTLAVSLENTGREQSSYWKETIYGTVGQQPSRWLWSWYEVTEEKTLAQLWGCVRLVHNHRQQAVAVGSAINHFASWDWIEPEKKHRSKLLLQFCNHTMTIDISLVRPIIDLIKNILERAFETLQSECFRWGPPQIRKT